MTKTHRNITAEFISIYFIESLLFYNLLNAFYFNKTCNFLQLVKSPFPYSYNGMSFVV